MELILALMMFAGMVVAWIVAPNGEKSAAEQPVTHEEEAFVTA